MKRFQTISSLALTLSIAFGLGLGCDSGGGSAESGASDGGGTVNPDGRPTGDGPCEEASECAGDVCVGIIDGSNPPVYCTEQCSPGSCPDGFYCDEESFALIDLSFCRFGSEDAPGRCWIWCRSPGSIRSARPWPPPAPAAPTTR